MRESNDWRLTNQDSYLKGVTLIWRRYRPASEESDHDHCEFCWAKFMDADLPDTLQHGYSTEDRYRWVCKTCFDDFLDFFDWRVLDEGSIER